MSSVAESLTIEGDRLRVPRSALELAGFRTWVTSAGFPDGVRATFVSGEVLLEMSPESLETHSKVKGELTIVLGQLARDLGEIYPDGALVTHSAAGLSCEPDLVFLSWDCIESGRVRFTPKANRAQDAIEIEGTPTLVVEVVSDSSVRKDLTLLRNAYRRAGVPEYWLVDARADLIRFEILCLQDGDYRASAASGEPQWSPVFGSAFTLSRAPNRAGRFAYRLEMAQPK